MAALSAIVIVGGMGLALVACLVRSELRDRQRARRLAQLTAQYRKRQPALPPTSQTKPRQEARMVTVDELVARIENEGLAVRLSWDDEEDNGQRG